MYIYGLQDPLTLEIRYIGQTSNPTLRRANHISKGKHNKGLKEWMDRLHMDNLDPRFLILAEAHTAAIADVKEQEWIALYRANGAQLLNVLDGGYATMRVSSRFRVEEKLTLIQFMINQDTLEALHQEVIARIGRGEQATLNTVGMEWFKRGRNMARRLGRAN